MFSAFQVAIHSVLEKLFRSIWSLPNSRAPFAIKYFFDFLDAQAENKKITDPDVVHIWKTNRWEQTVGDYCFQESGTASYLKGGQGELQNDPFIPISYILAW